MQRGFGAGIGIGVVLLVVLVGSAGAASASAGASCAEISGPTVIEQSGCYELNESEADSGAEVFVEIRSSNVTLDGAGHAIDGSGSGIGIHVNGSDTRLDTVTVTNLTVSDWETGLYYDASDDGAIRNVTATSNSDYGIHFHGATGVTATDVTVSDQQGYLGAGLRIEGSTDVTVSGLDSTNNENGVYVYGGSGHAIFNGSFADDAGVTVFDGTQVTVRDNAFEDTAPAVDIDDSGGVVVDNNTIVDGSLGGISGTSGLANRITNNDVYESSRYATGADCGGMTINGAADDLIANNTWTECNWGVLIQHSDRMEFTNNTISGTDGKNADYGLRVAGGSGHHIIDNHIVNNGRYPKRAGIFLGTHRATLSGNTLAGNGFNLDLGSGGNWSSLSHSIDATNTVEGRPVAYHVNETDVTVDPNAGWVGLVGTRNAVIADATFTENNWENVFLFEADDTVVRNVTTSPSWSAMRIKEGSDRTRIEDSSFDAGRGITLFEARGTRFVNTSITNSNSYGVYLSTDSPDTTFENVTITGSDRRGIAVRSGSSGSDRMTVANSTVSDNGWGGVDFYRGDHGVVRDSVIRNNGGDGVGAQSYVHNVTIARNSIVNNDNDGIDFGNYAADNRIVDNAIADNGGDGVAIGSYQAGNRIDGNTVSDNGGDGVSLGKLDGDDATDGENVVVDNEIAGNGVGVELGLRGYGDLVRGNVVTDNAVGVTVPDAYDNLTVYDNAFNNTDNVAIANASGLTNATFHVAATAGPNVIGGATIGGNFWAGPDGNGFGETCPDRGDGICDSPYALDDTHVDHLPLAAPDTGDAPARFAIEIDGTNGPVTVGQPLEVTATVQNAGDENATQTIALDLNGTEVDNRSVTLRGGNATTITLGYVPGDADAGSHTATVSSADESASVSIEVTDDSGDDGDDKDDGSGGGTPRPPATDDDDNDDGDSGDASDGDGGDGDGGDGNGGDGDEPDDRDTEDGTDDDSDTDGSNADSDDGADDGTETGDGTDEETIDDGADESDGDSEADADDADGDGVPGFGLLIGIAALLLALAVRVR